MKYSNTSQMNTEFPYDKGGNTLEEVIGNIFDNLKHKHESDVEVVTLTRSGFKEICEHIVEWQLFKTTNIQYHENTSSDIQSPTLE